MSNSLIHQATKIEDDAFLYVIEGQRNIPFAIKRIYYITKAVENLPRGLHAHKTLQQVLYCIQGEIDLILEDKQGKQTMHLDSPDKGIYLGPGVWHEMINFQPDTILLVVCSDYYQESDYIRNYEEFKKFTHSV